MNNFSYEKPENLAALFNVKSRKKEKGIVLAGSTNLMIYIKEGKYRDGTLIDISNIPELKGVELSGGMLKIGAFETIASLIESPVVAENCPYFHESIHSFANPLVRNMSTLGGNIADASPIADTAPVLLTLDAEVTLGSLSGERTIPLTDFFTGPGQTVMAPEEVVVSVSIPVRKEGNGDFMKLRNRRGTACSVVSAAVWLQTENETVQDIRIALGGVAPVPVRIRETEKLFTGKKLTGWDDIHKTAGKAAEEISPISDVRATDEYREQVAVRMVARAIVNSWEKGKA